MAFDIFRGFDFAGRQFCGSPSDGAPPKSVSADNRGRRALLLSFAALAGLSIGITEALAHSRLVKSEPAARAVVTKPLAEVKLWFNEAIEPAFAKVWIISGDGSQTPLTTRGDASDPRLVVVTLPASLPEGPVNIGYHVLSVDGHVVESQLSFTIQKPA